jgi:hypothetical protein
MISPRVVGLPFERSMAESVMESENTGCLGTASLMREPPHAEAAGAAADADGAREGKAVSD